MMGFPELHALVLVFGCKCRLLRKGEEGVVGQSDEP
jgi:hypothetical protein